MEPLVQRESRSASFGTKMAPSMRGRICVLWTQLLDLFVEQSGAACPKGKPIHYFWHQNGAFFERTDLRFMNSVTGSICRAKCLTYFAEGGSEFYENSVTGSVCTAKCSNILQDICPEELAQWLNTGLITQRSMVWVHLPGKRKWQI